ncbi:MAG: hypothetical protein JWM64_1815 [Frankiales bacterium]|nr:hypothetical protein [Frankiales bacterium]
MPVPTGRGRAAAAAPPSPALRRACLLALLVPALVTLAVQPFAPSLLRSAPLLLLVLHPYEPWSLLVSPRSSGTTFVLVVVVVRAVPCWADYWVGRWYGPVATAFLLQHRAGRLPGLVHRVFSRARVPLVLLYPGALVSVLAGSSSVPARQFFPVLLVGLTGWALLTRTVASLAAGPVRLLSDALLDHARLASALLVVVVVGACWRLTRPGAEDDQRVRD